MSQHGGRAAKRGRTEDSPESSVAKVQKSTLKGIFSSYPTDVTTEKSKYETYTQTHAMT